MLLAWTTSFVFCFPQVVVVAEEVVVAEVSLNFISAIKFFLHAITT